MPRCVIVAGGQIKDYGHVRSYLRPDDFVVYCDCGLKHRKNLAVEPCLVIGDFDSFEKPSAEIPVIELPTMKADTDSLYAIKECMNRGFGDFLLVGMLGGRVDHSLGNIYALLFLHENDCKAMLVTDDQEMWIVGKEVCYVEGDCRYFSLMNISGVARGICIRNAVYPLENAEILNTFQFGISNEVISGCKAEVSVKEGCLLLVRTISE